MPYFIYTMPNFMEKIIEMHPQHSAWSCKARKVMSSKKEVSVRAPQYLPARKYNYIMYVEIRITATQCACTRTCRLPRTRHYEIINLQITSATSARGSSIPPHAWQSSRWFRSTINHVERIKAEWWRPARLVGPAHARGGEVYKDTPEEFSVRVLCAPLPSPTPCQEGIMQGTGAKTNDAINN